MTPFLLYQLKTGVCIMLFTGLYYALFRKETFHRFNRFYLTSSILLSAILPVIQLPYFPADNTAGVMNFIGTVTVYADRVASASPQEVHQVSAIALVYMVMSLLFAVYLIYQLVNLIALISRRGYAPLGKYRIVVLPEKTQSFSFFNLVFLNPLVVPTNPNDQVLQHELAHARQRHSMDILIIQLLKIFQWFNPFVYLIEKALKETHEYLADEAVLEQDGQPDQYRMLLLTQVFGVQPGIFSFFNYSLIKNRLTMMTKEKSPNRNRLKYLTALPLILILGLLMCCKLNKKADIPPPPPPPPPPAESTTTAETIVPEDGEKAFIMVEVQATFQGGDINTFREWVQKSLVYPQEAVKNGIFGRVTVQFAVNSKGNVCDAKILRGVDPSLDNETIRVLNSAPAWVPAKQSGQDVKQQFVMPVIFALK